MKMKIVYFERPYARGWTQMDKIPMVVEETYPHDGIVDKSTLLHDYYNNRVLYYPDIPVQWGTGYEMERWCKDFMKIVEETNCTFKAVKARLKYFCNEWHTVVTATEITPEIFQKIKSSYAPYFAPDDKAKYHFYKIGNKLYYRTYLQPNGEDWGCGNQWITYTPEEWID